MTPSTAAHFFQPALDDYVFLSQTHSEITEKTKKTNLFQASFLGPPPPSGLRTLQPSRSSTMSSRIHEVAWNIQMPKGLADQIAKRQEKMKGEQEARKAASPPKQEPAKPSKSRKSMGRPPARASIGAPGRAGPKGVLEPSSDRRSRSNGRSNVVRGNGKQHGAGAPVASSAAQGTPSKAAPGGKSNVRTVLS